MKKVSRLAATLFLGVASIAVARADDPASQAAAARDNLSLQDPDGTPLVISHPREKGPSQADIDAQNKRNQQAAADSDWLLKGYEQQLQLHANSAGGENNNLYYRIATDKTLSKLAGVRGIDTTLDTASALKGAPGQGKLALRSDSPAAVKPASNSNLFTPLITPLGAADAAGLHNFYGQAQTAAPAPSPKADLEKDKNSTDFDMPGKVAADSDPLTKARLSFDSTLPDDALPQNNSHDSGFKAAMPLSTNADKVQKLTDAALMAPGSVKTVIPVNVSKEQLNLQPQEASPKLVTPSTAGRPISSPYSILDR